MHDLGLKTSIQAFDAFVRYTLMGNQLWPQFQNGVRERSVDSPFNEDSKNIIFFQGGPNFGEGRSENLGKWAITGTPVVMQIGR